MPTGTVKRFNATKGYGFIAPEDSSKDAFVHISAVERAGLVTVQEGQRVRRRCIDLKTLAMQLIGGGYANAAKRNMPANWFSGQRHSHIAVQDAIEQGGLFVNIVEALREERRARSGDHA